MSVIASAMRKPSTDYKICGKVNAIEPCSQDYLALHKQQGSIRRPMAELEVYKKTVRERSDVVRVEAELHFTWGGGSAITLKLRNANLKNALTVLKQNRTYRKLEANIQPRLVQLVEAFYGKRGVMHYDPPKIDARDSSRNVRHSHCVAVA